MHKAINTYKPAEHIICIEKHAKFEALEYHLYKGICDCSWVAESNKYMVLKSLINQHIYANGLIYEVVIEE